MECKKCRAHLISQTNFCPYCGEKMDTSSSDQDLFARCRSNSNNMNSRQDQMAMSTANFSFKKDLSRDHKSLIGLLLAIVAIFLCFVHPFIGIFTVIIALILVILGLRTTSQGIKIVSLLVTVLSLGIVGVISVFLFLASLEMTVHGYQTTVGDYLKSAFFSGYRSHELNGYWISQEQEVLYLDLDQDEYHLYMNLQDRTSEYFSGKIDLEEGYTLRLGDREETLYVDDDYYYYTLNTDSNQNFSNLSYRDDILALFQEKVILKLDKDHFDTLILYYTESNIQLKLDRF
ncbi:MAG: hypothetical protein PUB18_02335 [bacterium]|nr:hypothetical protein [bacterium]